MTQTFFDFRSSIRQKTARSFPADQTTVTEDTPFYLNAEGEVVISFPEYSIAPGFMGIQEFVIS